MKAKDTFLNFIKGAIIGIANIIPGVSGGTLAVSLGIYEMMLDAIGNFFKNIKKNIKLLLPILLGAVIGVLSASKLISYLLENFEFQTILLFIGLIIGGISLLFRKVKGKKNVVNILIFILSFGVVLGLNLLKTEALVSFSNLGIFDYLKLVLVGGAASGAMIIPGVSGSFILMLFGYYKPIIGIVSNITNFSNLGSNLLVLIPFGIGIILGVILIAKLLSYLLKKFEVKTYFAILGFVFASIVILVMQIKPFTPTFVTIFTGILAFLWGLLLARNFDKE